MRLPFLPLEGSIAPSHVFSSGGGGGFQLVLFILSAYTVAFLHLCETCRTCVLPPVIMVKQRPRRGRASSCLQRNTRGLHHENIHSAGWSVGSTPRSNKSRCCPANNHPSVGRLSLQSKAKGLKHILFSISGMKGPGRCLHSIRNTSAVSYSSSQPAVSQSLFFFNLTDLREVKAELWKVIRPQNGINKHHLFLQEDTEDLSEDKELLLTQLLRPHADFYQRAGSQAITDRRSGRFISATNRASRHIK